MMKMDGLDRGRKDSPNGDWLGGEREEEEEKRRKARKREKGIQLAGRKREA
jgi:3'-phosphoadenosine 5'-phosphosulfate sulfotransferase (PAPS reductase)/FAD synthetase